MTTSLALYLGLRRRHRRARGVRRPGARSAPSSPARSPVDRAGGPARRPAIVAETPSAARQRVSASVTRGRRASPGRASCRWLVAQVPRRRSSSMGGLAGGVRRARPPRVGRAGVACAGRQVNVVAPAGRLRRQGASTSASPSTAAGGAGALRRELPRDLPVLAKLRSDVLRRGRDGAGSSLDAGAAAVVIGNALPRPCPDGRAGRAQRSCGPSARAALRGRGAADLARPARRGRAPAGSPRRRTPARSSRPEPAPSRWALALLHDPTTGARASSTDHAADRTRRSRPR